MSAAVGGGSVHGERMRRAGLWFGPLAAALVLFLPDLPLDQVQRRAAAVTALVAVWWLSEAIPIGATSLLPAALLPLLGVVDAREAAGAYMNDLIFLFLGAFILALGVEHWGVHRRVALAIVGRVGARPRRIVFGFMLASAVLSMWLNNTATTLMMLPIGVAVVRAVRSEGEVEGEDPFALALLLGLAYSASVGGVATPVGTAPNQVYLARMLEDHAELPPVTFAVWLLAWGPLVVIFLPLGWLVLTRVVLRVPDHGTAGGEVIAAERAALGPIRAPEWRMGAVFLVTALLWVGRADLDFGVFTLPGWERAVAYLAADPASWTPGTVSNSTVAIGMAVLCFLVPAGSARPGERLVDWSTARALPWDVLLLIGGGFAIAAGFKASGLDRAIGELLGPAFGSMPPLLLLALVVGSMAMLTEITSNTATTQVLLPVLGSASVAAGIDPRDAMLPATIAAYCAFMLPVATPPNAVAYSSGMVRIGRMARVGVAFNLLLVGLIVVVYRLWVRPLLGVP